MPSVVSSMPYYVPGYTQFGQPTVCMPNQYSHPAMNYGTSAFGPTNLWSFEQYAPFNSYDSQSQIKQSPYVDHSYFNQYEQNVSYESHLPTNQMNSNAMLMENVAIEPKWHTQQGVHTFVPEQTDNSERYLPAENQDYSCSHKTNDHQSDHQNSDNLKCDETESEFKKKKIPRPMNSFMLYAKRHRTKVHELYPLCDNRTVSKILSETWYALDSEKKQKYNDLAAEMRRDHFRLHPDFKWKTSSEQTLKLNDRRFDSAFEDLKITTDQSSFALNPEKDGTSTEYEKDDGSSLYSPTTPSTESSLSPINYIDGMKYVNEPFVPVSQHTFRLGPTPVQIRNKSGDVAEPSVDEAAPLETIEVPNQQNDCDKNDANDLSIISNEPLFQKRFRALPQFNFNQYRKEWDTNPATMPVTYNTNTRKRSKSKPPTNDPLPVKRVVRNRFFGPDFNVNHFKGKWRKMHLLMLFFALCFFHFQIDDDSDKSHSWSPVTPNSADDKDMLSEKVQNKKKSQMINQRKSLIMELFQKCGFFPSSKDIDGFLVKLILTQIVRQITKYVLFVYLQNENVHLFRSKSFLNIKIREYRQKHMQNVSPAVSPQ